MLATDNSSVSECDQMKLVADSLKPNGSRFDNEISYEINGCILTWIANDSGSEHRFDCTNIIEIIDGYYKAEFYLDTKRIFEAPLPIDMYENNTGFELTNDVPNCNKQKIQKKETHKKVQSFTSTTSTHQLSEINPKLNQETKFEVEVPSPMTPTPRNKEHRHPNPTEKVRDKSHALPPKRTMETRMSVKPGFNLRGSKGHKNLDITGNYYTKENTKPINYYSKIHNTGNETVYQPELRKRKYARSEPSKKKQEVEVRRGERIRKVSIFQDCYIPTSRNEWISEVFIGAHKENF